MGALQVLRLDVRLFVGVLGVLDYSLALVTGQELSQIAEVVALHFEVEHLCVSSPRIWNELIVEEGEHTLADLFQLFFNFVAIAFDQLKVFRALVLFLVLNSRDSSPGGTAGTD